MKATKYQKKSLIKLEDLLRKRKTNLKKFLVERGITTYSVLEETCSRLGVITPNFETFNTCIPSYVSDPTAGVVVVPPLDVVVESTGQKENEGEVFAAIPPTSGYESSLSFQVEHDLGDDGADALKLDQDADGKVSYKKKFKKSNG